MTPADRVGEERGGGAKLTAKQRVALRVYDREGELNEGLLYEEWPAIRSPRLVTNGLVKKGLVTLGAYWGPETGYELHLTPEGLRAVAEATA